MKQIKTINFIVGSNGSGKNEVLSILTKKIDQSKFIKSYTTRLPRDGEIQGQDYIFVNNDLFGKIKSLSLFMETNQFGGTFYGHHQENFLPELENNNHFFFIIDPNGIYQILKWFRENEIGKNLSIKYEIKFKIIHIKAKKSIRLKRLLSSVNKNLDYNTDFDICDNIITRLQRDDDNIASTLEYLIENDLLSDVKQDLIYSKIDNNDTLMTLTTKYLTELIDKSNDINYYNIP